MGVSQLGCVESCKVNFIHGEFELLRVEYNAVLGAQVNVFQCVPKGVVNAVIPKQGIIHDLGLAREVHCDIIKPAIVGITSCMKALRGTPVTVASPIQ